MRLTRIQLLLCLAHVLACASQACAGRAEEQHVAAVTPPTMVQPGPAEAPESAEPATAGGEEVAVVDENAPVDFDFRDAPELELATGTRSTTLPAVAGQARDGRVGAASGVLADAEDAAPEDEPADGELATQGTGRTGGNAEEAPPTDAVGATEEPDFVDQVVQVREQEATTRAGRTLHATVQASRTFETEHGAAARKRDSLANDSARSVDGTVAGGFADADESVLGEANAAPEPDFAAGPLPMFGAIMLHKVKNYAAWRAAFDETLPERRRAGFVAQGIMRGVDDPNLIAVWLAVTDVAQAHAYFGNKWVRARIGKAGIVGRVQVRLSSNVSARMEPGRTGLTAALITLRVEDFPRFAALVEAAGSARDEPESGIVGYALSQDVVDAHRAYLYLQGESAAPLRRYLAEPRTRQQWRDAGVRGSPFVTIVQEGELAQCR